MKNLSNDDLRAFARKGAVLELERIFALFPDLRNVSSSEIRKAHVPFGMLASAAAGAKKYGASNWKPVAKKKRKHWTQTPEGRKRMRQYAKRAWRKRDTSA